MNEDNLGPFEEQNDPVRPHLPLWFSTYTGHSVPLERVKQSSADEGRINYSGQIAWTERGPSGRWTERLNYEGPFGGGSYNCEICVKHHESLFKMYVVCVTEEWWELDPKLSFMPHQLKIMFINYFINNNINNNAWLVHFLHVCVYAYIFLFSK